MIRSVILFKILQKNKNLRVPQKRLINMEMYLAQKYFKIWKDNCSFRRYDRWCEENYEWLAKEQLYNCTDFTRFISGFKV